MFYYGAASSMIRAKRGAGFRRCYTAGFAILASVCGVAGGINGAAAADLSTASGPSWASGPGWIVTVGAMATYGPDYAGSDKNSLSAIPNLSWRRAGEAPEFSAPDDSFGLTLYKMQNFRFGVVGALRSGRSDSDDHRLTGLDNYDWTIEAGVFAEYWLVRDLLRTRVEVRHGLDSDDGFVIDLGADFVRHAGRFTLSAGPRLSLADSNLMDLKYGVSPEAAARNGQVSPFSAGGGLQSVGVSGAISYALTEAVTTTLYGRYDRLMDDAADSPITKQFGSEDQFTVGLGLTYSFAFSR